MDAFGRMMVRWEDAGAWTIALKQVVYSVVPTPNAEHEAGLRPIGLLPYVCRVWMATRKGQDALKQWSLDIHDGSHAGAVTLAARPRASIEGARLEGQHMLLAFLGCSKCFGNGRACVGRRSGSSQRDAREACKRGLRHVPGKSACARTRGGGATEARQPRIGCRMCLCQGCSRGLYKAAQARVPRRAAPGRCRRHHNPGAIGHDAKLRSTDGRAA